MNTNLVAVAALLKDQATIPFFPLWLFQTETMLRCTGHEASILINHPIYSHNKALEYKGFIFNNWGNKAQTGEPTFQKPHAPTKMTQIEES